MIAKLSGKRPIEAPMGVALFDRAAVANEDGRDARSRPSGGDKRSTACPKGVARPRYQRAS
jgi:hypothetical protein